MSEVSPYKCNNKLERSVCHLCALRVCGEFVVDVWLILLGNLSVMNV